MLGKQSGNDPVTQGFDSPEALYAVRFPVVFLNNCIKSVYPAIKENFHGEMRDEQLDLTLTWKLHEVPEIISPYYLPEMQCTLDLTLRAGNGTPVAISVYVNALMDFSEVGEGYALKIFGNPYLKLTPEDSFAKAILMSKIGQVFNRLNKLFAVPIISRKIPDVFPGYPLMEMFSYPFGEPEVTDFVLRSHHSPSQGGQKKVTDIMPRALGPMAPAKEERGDYDDFFRVQIHGLILSDVMREKFWEPMEKEFTQEGALIRLLNFNLEMKDDYFALVVELGGRVRVDISGLPDPEWSVDFKAPLDVHLKLYVTADNTVRLKYDETFFPPFELNPNNAWADIYGALIPGLTEMIGSKIGSAIIENVLGLVGDIDELLFELQAQTFEVEGKTVAVTPKITEIKSYGPSDEYYLNFAGVMDIKVS